MENQIRIQPAAGIDGDCSLILDAVRRLKEGTWNLCDEDSDWADHLLPIIKEALDDHIEYENACLLPDLPKNLAQKHCAEHCRILALLCALDGARLRKDANHFKALLDLLLETLDHHHHKFGRSPTHLNECSNQRAKDRIMRRAKGANLECK